MYKFQHAFLGLFLCASVPISAQSDQGGFLSPGDSVQKILPYERIIFLPNDGFSFYTVPNGEFKGKILPGPPLNHQGTLSAVDSLLTSTITGVQIRPQLLSLDNYFETSDNRYHLSFDRQQDGFVRVMRDGYQGWISLEEIKEKGFVLTSWMEFYGASKGNKIHPREKLAVVRAAPHESAAIIETADELYSEITTMGICQSSFCKVKVVQFKNPYDLTKSKEENIIKSYKGWIQIIDKDGQPLVAHNSHGT